MIRWNEGKRALEKSHLSIFILVFYYIIVPKEDINKISGDIFSPQENNKIYTHTSDIFPDTIEFILGLPPFVFYHVCISLILILAISSHIEYFYYECKNCYKKDTQYNLGHDIIELMDLLSTKYISISILSKEYYTAITSNIWSFIKGLFIILILAVLLPDLLHTIKMINDFLSLHY